MKWERKCTELNETDGPGISDKAVLKHNLRGLVLPHGVLILASVGVGSGLLDEYSCVMYKVCL